MDEGGVETLSTANSSSYKQQKRRKLKVDPEVESVTDVSGPSSRESTLSTSFAKMKNTTEDEARLKRSHDDQGSSQKSELYFKKAFEYEYGAQKNITQAFLYYVRAAELGHFKAAYSVGLLYSGQIEIDDLEAAAWFKKANDISESYFGTVYLDALECYAVRLYEWSTLYDSEELYRRSIEAFQKIEDTENRQTIPYIERTGNPTGLAIYKKLREDAIRENKEYNGNYHQILKAHSEL